MRPTRARSCRGSPSSTTATERRSESSRGRPEMDAKERRRWRRSRTPDRATRRTLRVAHAQRVAQWAEGGAGTRRARKPRTRTLRRLRERARGRVKLPARPSRGKPIRPAQGVVCHTHCHNVARKPRCAATSCLPRTQARRCGAAGAPWHRPPRHPFRARESHPAIGTPGASHALVGSARVSCPRALP